MISNTCVYGTTPSVASLVEMKYISYNFEEIIEKSHTSTQGIYQFHLGDTDMLTIARGGRSGDSMVLMSYTDSGTLEHASTYVIEEIGGINRYDLDTGAGIVVDTNEAAMVDNSTNIAAQLMKYEEDVSTLYSYFKIELGGEIKAESNGEAIKYVPVINGEYTVTQKSVNSTSGLITEKITIVDVLGANQEILSIDYVFYGKKNKVLQVELPSYVTSSLILEAGWYYENNKLLGKNSKLAAIEMPYARGKVIIKSQVGDIVDY